MTASSILEGFGWVRLKWAKSGAMLKEMPEPPRQLTLDHFAESQHTAVHAAPHCASPAMPVNPPGLCGIRRY